MTMNFNVELPLVLSVMPVSGLESYVTMMLVLVRNGYKMFPVGGLNVIVEI